jgi:hypothetical protein
VLFLDVPASPAMAAIGTICSSYAGQSRSSSPTSMGLARNGRDWHHLLELCGPIEVIVTDLDGRR